MNKKRKIGLIAVFVAVVAVIGALALMLNHKTTQEGTKHFQVQIVSERDGYDETRDCTSDAEFLGQFLRTLEGCEYEESDYGIFITGFAGMESDQENQYWWGVFVNGESAVTGADEIPLKDGEVYSLILMQGW